MDQTHKTPFSLEEVLEGVVDLKSPNPQLFENSGLAQHPVTEAANTDPDRLFRTVERGDNNPNFAISNEKPEHRFILYLKGQGMSNREIAVKMGYTDAWVSQITRQPWFRLRLVQELREAGVDQIQQVLKANALDSVFTLVDLRDDTTAPKAVRKAAADSLLDRYIGKPTQRIESEEKRTPTSEELTQLDRQIAELDKEIKGAQP